MGFTDIETIYGCYFWELDAILEGLQINRVNRREDLAELAAKVRYTMNAKTVQQKTLFDRNKEIGKIRGQKTKPNNKELAKRIRRANQHFSKLSEGGDYVPERSD